MKPVSLDGLWCLISAPMLQLAIGAVGLAGIQRCWSRLRNEAGSAPPSDGPMTPWLQVERRRRGTRYLLLALMAVILAMLPLQGITYVLTKGKSCQDPLTHGARQALTAWVGLLLLATVLGAAIAAVRRRDGSA